MKINKSITTRRTLAGGLVCLLAINLASCQRLNLFGSKARPTPDTEQAQGSREEDIERLDNDAAAATEEGDYIAAEQRYKKLLATAEADDGADSVSVAAALNALAGVYYAQEQYAKAEPLVQRALNIYEKQFGEYDSNVAASLNNLANLYRNQGEYRKAEPLYKRALAIQERALSADHPDVIKAKKNYAAMLRATGRREAAQKVMTEPPQQRKDQSQEPDVK